MALQASIPGGLMIVGAFGVSLIFLFFRCIRCHRLSSTEPPSAPSLGLEPAPSTYAHTGPTRTANVPSSQAHSAPTQPLSVYPQQLNEPLPFQPPESFDPTRTTVLNDINDVHRIFRNHAGQGADGTQHYVSPMLY